VSGRRVGIRTDGTLVYAAFAAGLRCADEFGVPPFRPPALVKIAFAALSAVLGAYVVLLATGTGQGTPQDVLYFTLMGGACILCLARSVAGGDRLVWLLLGGALLLWLGGDVVWTFSAPPSISIADAGYLGFYVLALPALVLLLRSRASGTLATLWADGWVAALTVASVAAYFFVEPVLAGTGGGDLATLLVNLAYPLADTLLLALVVGAAVATRGTVRSSWLVLGLALATMAISDGVYLNLSWAGTYDESTLLEAGWPAAALALGWASWASFGERADRRALGEHAPIVWPIAWGGGSLAVVAVLGVADDNHPLAVGLAVAGVLSVFGRLMLTDAQNRRLVAAASRQALTDPVTGLGNHRALTLDLETALRSAAASRSVLLALFDLNGFKDYNDLFGHPAGDALLERLGSRLREVAGDDGHAYRMGGDEFCLLVEVEAGVGQELLLARAGHALSEHGDGFEVTAAGGHVLAEPRRISAAAALRTADARMYAAKRSARSSSLQQATDVLAAAALERDPRTAVSDGRIGRLAEMTARGLGLDDELVAQVRHAARLHDVGKLAIPDEILDKPGPLDDAELEFVHRHTIVGERIAAAAPALAPVARLIRSSHERWDGAGYPDGLAGTDIPLGARILFVCASFEAMTSDRPYRPALSDFDAIVELVNNAGSQFDPGVVRAFTVALSDGEQPSALAA
jgi:diguanylate cyclase (GGDEF)-like protein